VCRCDYKYIKFLKFGGENSIKFSELFLDKKKQSYGVFKKKTIFAHSFKKQKNLNLLTKIYLL